MFRQASEAAGFNFQRENQEPPRAKRTGWSAAPAKAKKIPRDLGEYIKFSEVKVESSTYGSAPDKSSWATEQQVVDVTWQDIP